MITRIIAYTFGDLWYSLVGSRYDNSVARCEATLFILFDVFTYYGSTTENNLIDK
jgi:hypothetical protein